MSLHDSKARLGASAERLQLRWLEAQAEWNDPQSREVERAHLVPLESHLRAAQGAIDRLAEVIAKAQRDCRE